MTLTGSLHDRKRPCDYGWEEEWGDEIEAIGATMNRMGIVG